MSGSGYKSSEDSEIPFVVDEQFLENITYAWDEDIMEEQHLLLNTCFIVEPTFTVHCGLSPTRYFSPAVNIVFDTYSKISLDRLEWNEFILTLTQWIEEFFNKSNYDDISKGFNCNKNVKLSTLVRLDGIKLAILSKNNVVHYFTRSEVMKLISESEMIFNKIEFLLNLNICEYYWNFLDRVNTLLLRYHYMINTNDIVMALCNLSCNLETYCIFEYFNVNRDKFLSDLDNRRYV